MSGYPRHKVFISFHHEDQAYKDSFVRMMESNIVDRSIDDGDIDDGLAVDTIRRKIRDEFIADATVTVVLVGACTWQRKHVDWEIGSSLRGHQKKFQMRPARHPATHTSGLLSGQLYFKFDSTKTCRQLR